MARPRNWDALSPAYRARLQRNGITRQAYVSGASVKDARGHKATPEHGLRDAAKNPQRYQEYLHKKRPGGGQRPPANLEDLKDRAFASMDGKIGSYFKYNRNAVIARVNNMSERQLRLTIAATEDDLLALAAIRRKSNPWHYH